MKTISHTLLKILILNLSTLCLVTILFYITNWFLYKPSSILSPFPVIALTISNVTFIVGNCLQLLDQKWFPEKKKQLKHKEAYLIGSFITGAVFIVAGFIINVTWFLKN